MDNEEIIVPNNATYILINIIIKERGIMRTCSVEGCENKHYGKGYCDKHYRQFKKYGCILERTKFDANEIIEHDDYAEMILYNNKGKEVARALIDLEYVDVIKDYKWHINNYGYVVNDKVGLLHRLLMNPDENLVIDHINHNPLDNRICNLRICTQQENLFNKSVRCNNTSGITGVAWYKRRNKWTAYVNINGKKNNLGYFNTLEEATEARRRAEIEYFGEYAPTNN